MKKRLRIHPDASGLPDLLTLTFANSGKTLRLSCCGIDVAV